MISHSLFNSYCLISDFGRGTFVCTEQLNLREKFVMDKVIEAEATGINYEFRQIEYTPEQWGPSYIPTWYTNWTMLEFKRTYLRLILKEKHMRQVGLRFQGWDKMLPKDLETSKLKDYGEWLHDFDIIQKATDRFKSYWRQEFPVEYPAMQEIWNCVVPECDEIATFICLDRDCGVRVCWLHGPNHCQHQGHILTDMENAHNRAPVNMTLRPRPLPSSNFRLRF